MDKFLTPGVMYVDNEHGLHFGFYQGTDNGDIQGYREIDLDKWLDIQYRFMSNLDIEEQIKRIQNFK